MKIVEHENRYSETFLNAYKGDVFRYDSGIFMRTTHVKDVFEKCEAEYNAVCLVTGEMTFFEDNDNIEILNKAQLII